MRYLLLHDPERDELYAAAAAGETVIWLVAEVPEAPHANVATARTMSPAVRVCRNISTPRFLEGRYASPNIIVR